MTDRVRTQDDVPVGRLRGFRPRVRPIDSHDDPASPLNLDKLIHERLRLAIVSALAVRDKLSFNDLKAALRTTDGNLSVHARKLEDAGYISCTKSFEGRLPRSEYTLTRAGRVAFERYLGHMDALIRACRAGSPTATET
ncbi:MAG: transcriptional regulator [Acidobacteria bacterium]|nr:transcriptional regulator [Acidobacteriota bacterium]